MKLILTSKTRNSAGDRFLLPLFAACLLLLSAASCKKSNADGGFYRIPVQIDSMNTGYLFSNTDGSSDGGGHQIYFTYQGGRVTTREGAFMPLLNGSGVVYFFSPLVYDTLIYTGDNITILTRSRDANLTPGPNERDIVIQDSRIVKITTSQDTTIFYYYTNGTLAETDKYTSGTITTRDFTYDEKNNLTQAVIEDVSNYDGSLISSESVVFSQYDAAENPLKDLDLWDDLLYRSLSRNNFATYGDYGTIGSGTYTGGFTQTLSYDDKGNIDYSK